MVGGALALAAVGWSILGADPDVDLAITGIFRSLMYGGIAGLALGVFVQPMMARLTKGRQGPVLVGDIGALIPVSRQERGWYAAVAVSAGIGSSCSALQSLSDSARWQHYCVCRRRGRAGAEADRRRRHRPGGPLLHPQAPRLA